MLDAERVTAIIAHMNEDHADAVLGYVHRLARLPAATSARLLHVDARQMQIEAHIGEAVRIVAIPFDHELRDADDLRDTLIALARASHAPE